MTGVQFTRIRQLAQDQPAFQTYLSSFTNEFGDAVDPSIILWRDDAPERYRGVDAIAGFRDAIAMAVIPYAWARVLRYDNNRGIKYADYFSVYPWMVDKKYEGLITRTLNMVRAETGHPSRVESVQNGPVDHAPVEELVRERGCGLRLQRGDLMPAEHPMRNNARSVNGW